MTVTHLCEDTLHQAALPRPRTYIHPVMIMRQIQLAFIIKAIEMTSNAPTITVKIKAK